MDSISFITAHFSDFDWTSCWLNHILRYTDSSLIHEFLIINQDRTIKSYKKLASLDKKVKVLDYPPNQTIIAKQGHDHAYVLNLAVQEAQGNYVCIMDSDCHPFSAQWINKCDLLFQEFDAVAAVDYYKLKNESQLLTHPCFLMFDRHAINFHLQFDEGLFDCNMDTGRLIGKQIEQAGKRVHYAIPKKSFSSLWGFIYLDCIYHHERGSYRKADVRLRKQIDWRQGFFKNIVISKERYYLSKAESFYYQLRSRTLPRTKKKLISFLSLPKRIYNKFMRSWTN